MMRSCQLALGVSVLLCGGAALAPAQSLPFAAKPAAKTAPTEASFRTADGQPDLQGIWTNNTVVPLERPADLGDKAVFTQEEAAAYAKRQLVPEATGKGTYGDVHYNMTQFGLEKSQTRVATSVRTSLITDPPNGRIPPMTPEAVERNAARAAKNKGHEFDSAENRPLSEQCILWGNEGPPMMPVTYNSNMQIVQGDGYVAILQEVIHNVRMIPTDGSAHIPADVREWEGDSRGHWEGDTLVVDTANFTDKAPFHGSSGSLHVVERFQRVNVDTIRYQFTVEDPHTWARPWSGEMLLTKIDGPIFEYACHEGNYGMANNLSGARAEEENKAQETK